MTDHQIKKTIADTKAAIAGKIGLRAKYSLDLKKDILTVVDIMGAAQFSKETGLADFRIYHWKHALAFKKNVHGRVSQ